jgi:hypothetical protein
MNLQDEAEMKERQEEACKDDFEAVLGFKMSNLQKREEK